MHGKMNTKKKKRRKGIKINECRKGGASVLWGMQNDK